MEALSKEESTFLSTLSLRRATGTRYRRCRTESNFYPRSPCGERLQCRQPRPRRPFISIHALLAESDPYQDLHRPPRPLFLSTLSLRRATESRPPCARPTTDFYPRSPCGERQLKPPVKTHRQEHFYPRSPCGERQPAERHANNQQEFLSTLSLRRATTVPRGGHIA